MNKDDSQKHALTISHTDWWEVLLLATLTLGAISFPLFFLFFR
jgi:hypothetical protein